MGKQTVIVKEKAIVTVMIELYCRGNHAGHERGQLCESCAELAQYAHKRLTHCRFQDAKTSCQRCPIHCYQPQKRAEMQAVMRYAGPRMLIYRPFAYLKHLFY